MVLARRDSSRLPDKALRLLVGRPILEHVLRLCGRVTGVDLVCLATTERAIDDELAHLANLCGCAVFRGDADDVAARFYAAIEHYRLDGALRVNGDSPLHRPTLLATGVEMFRREQPDLVTNVPGRSFPYGISVEVVAAQAMARARQGMRLAVHKEHVTKFFYDHPGGFRTLQMPDGPPIGRGLQLAVDCASDLERAASVAELLGDRLYEASLEEVIAIARSFETRATDPAVREPRAGGQK